MYFTNDSMLSESQQPLTIKGRRMGRYGFRATIWKTSPWLVISIL